MFDLAFPPPRLWPVSHPALPGVSPTQRLHCLALSLAFSRDVHELAECTVDAEAAFSAASTLTLARLARRIATDPDAATVDHVSVRLALDVLAARLPQPRAVIAARLTRPNLATRGVWL